MHNSRAFHLILLSALVGVGFLVSVPFAIQASGISSVITTTSPRATNISAPASGSQATTTLVAGGAGIRNVADCLCYSARAGVAPAATSVNVVLRDGASGAGTIVWQQVLHFGAAVGNLVTPFCSCGFNIQGTANTAMTMEFSAGVANVDECVTFTSYRAPCVAGGCP